MSNIIFSIPTTCISGLFKTNFTRMQMVELNNIFVGLAFFVGGEEM